MWVAWCKWEVSPLKCAVKRGSTIFKPQIHKILENYVVLSFVLGILILLKITPSPKCFAHLLQCIGQGKHGRICHLYCILRWWRWCSMMSHAACYNWVKRANFFLVFWPFAFSIVGRDETSRRRHRSKSKLTPRNCPYPQIREIHKISAVGVQLNLSASVDFLFIGFTLALFLSICKLHEIF